MKMLKRRRLLNQEAQNLDEQYFTEIRPKLYELHADHEQHGTRKGRTLAEHLDSACQFVLTVSKIAQVPDEKRGCIVAATAVHDLNKLDALERNVKTLARDRAFLEEQLERAGVRNLVKTDEDLELVRKLIERHSGHNVSDGTRFLPEDPNTAKWAAMLIGGDLFDLGIEEDKRIRKVENELTVAFGRPSRLFKVTLSEDRGYLTSLLLSACEDVLHSRGLHTLAINPDSQIYEGESFPEEDLTNEIAKQWQRRINRVFGSNIEQLVTDKSTNGIKVDQKAIEQDVEATLERVDVLLAKKYSSYKASKVSQSIEKYSLKAGQNAVSLAIELGLLPVSTAEEFAISEGLKAAYVSYRQVKPELKPNQVWEKLSQHMGLSTEQCKALEAFEEQYGRCLFAVKASPKGMAGAQAALRESFQMRLVEAEAQNQDTDIEVPEKFLEAVKTFLNLPCRRKQNLFDEFISYIEASPNQRSSLGSIRAEVNKLRKPQMPPETKVQIFSNRLAGGGSGDPVRCADSLSALGYQLLQVGANFPVAKKKSKSGGEAPVHIYYLHFSLPRGSSPRFQGILRGWLRETASNNADGGAVKANEWQLYRENSLAFEADKFEGFSFPKRPEFTYCTVPIPVVWGDVNSSTGLLKSLRLALEISLATDFGFPFVLTSNLEVEPAWDVFARVEGIPSSLQSLLGNGIYYRQGHVSTKEPVTAEQVLERLQCIGNLSISVASLKEKDDCLYDLAKAAQKPLSIYHVLLRWILRKKDESNLDFILDEIRPNLSRLMEIIMCDSDKVVSQYLREAAQVACEGKLWGNLRRRTGRSEPFSAFLKAIRSCKKPLDWETVFASLITQYHTRLDRIREHGVGSPKYEYIKRYYEILEKLFCKGYQSKPERILGHAKDLEAAYLHFLREEYRKLNPKNEEQE